MLTQAPQKHSPNAISHAEAEKWLKKNGNGMAKLPKEKQKMDGYWRLYGKIPTKNLVTDYFNHYDVLVPSDIQDASCCQNVQNMCNKLMRAGELVRVTISKKGINPGGGDKAKRVAGYKRA